MSDLYTPKRGDIIWLDFEPARGKEIGKYRPALVLSSAVYNQQMGLLICCPISTSIRGHVTEVLLENLDQPCVVAASLIHTLSWKERKAKFIAQVPLDLLNEVLLRLIPLIGGESLLKQFDSE